VHFKKENYGTPKCVNYDCGTPTFEEIPVLASQRLGHFFRSKTNHRSPAFYSAEIGVPVYELQIGSSIVLKCCLFVNDFSNCLKTNENSIYDTPKNFRWNFDFGNSRENLEFYWARCKDNVRYFSRSAQSYCKLSNYSGFVKAQRFFRIRAVPMSNGLPKETPRDCKFLLPLKNKKVSRKTWWIFVFRWFLNFFLQFPTG